MLLRHRGAPKAKIALRGNSGSHRLSHRQHFPVIARNAERVLGGVFSRIPCL